MEQKIIQAIETEYNGYRFRSRLEARWAVFFDAAGIKYEYEPEGFELDDGTRYLPDFYLPRDEIYIEVKGNRKEALKEIEKAAKVCCMSTDRMLVVLSDIPNIEKSGIWVYNAFYYHRPEKHIMWRPVLLQFFIDDYTEQIDYRFISHYVMNRSAELFDYTFFRIFERSSNSQIHSLFPIPGCDCYIFETGSSAKEFANCSWESNTKDLFPYYLEEEDENYEIAKRIYSIARQVRFEHGETPTAEQVYKMVRCKDDNRSA